MQWKNGQIDAHQLPNGCFVSADLAGKRIELLRSNTAYRERIETAMRMSGSVDKSLVIARGGAATAEAESALVRQNAKAEQLIKGKNDENVSAGGIILPSGV